MAAQQPRPRGLAEHPLKQPDRRGRAEPRAAYITQDAPPAKGEPTEGVVTLTPAEGRVASSSTPEQQAAFGDLTNGWYRERLLEAVAGVGNIEDAARICGIAPSSVYRLAASDSTLNEGLQLARRRFGQKALGKATSAFLAASNEQIMSKPVLPIAVVNWYNPELRPNGGPVVDNRQLTVNVLSDQQAEAVARALAGVTEGEIV